MRKLMCTEPAKNSIIGNGITKGTNDVNQINSSAKMFPNNRKLSDKGL
jgi:hypothetical protein